MRSALAILVLSASVSAFACASAPAPNAGSTDGATSTGATLDTTTTTSGTPPKPVPATPFARIQSAPITDDDRYARCKWSETTLRLCSGIADIRRTVQVCNDCLVDADCDAGKRCADATLPGPSFVKVRGCVAPDAPCFDADSCPRPNVCTLVDTSVVCRQQEICEAP
jgi:hypothetical protein